MTEPRTRLYPPPRGADRRSLSTATTENRSRHYRTLKNPFQPWRVFSDDRVEALHNAALGISKTRASRCCPRTHARAFGLAGATVDESH